MSESPNAPDFSTEVTKLLASLDLGPDLPEPMRAALVQALVWVCRLDANRADRPA